jgi:hypothetical protein
MEDILLWVVLLGVVISTLLNLKKMKGLHLTMNSRLDELLDVTKKLARAEGFKAGQEDHLGALKEAGSNLDKPK